MRERLARIICYWSEPSTCHDAYCTTQCIAKTPDECWWKAADAIIAAGFTLPEIAESDRETALNAVGDIFFGRAAYRSSADMLDSTVQQTIGGIVDGFAQYISAVRAQMQAQIDEAETDAEHFNRLAFVDLGALHPVTWKEKATAAEQALERARTVARRLYEDLGTLKWMGADEGWERAISAVREWLAALEPPKC